MSVNYRKTNKRGSVLLPLSPSSHLPVPIDLAGQRANLAAVAGVPALA